MAPIETPHRIVIPHHREACDSKSLPGVAHQGPCWRIATPCAPTQPGHIGKRSSGIGRIGKARPQRIAATQVPDPWIDRRKSVLRSFPYAVDSRPGLFNSCTDWPEHTVFGCAHPDSGRSRPLTSLRLVVQKKR